MKEPPLCLQQGGRKTSSKTPQKKTKKKTKKTPENRKKNKQVKIFFIFSIDFEQKGIITLRPSRRGGGGGGGGTKRRLRGQSPFVGLKFKSQFHTNAKLGVEPQLS